MLQLHSTLGPSKAAAAGSAAGSATAAAEGTLVAGGGLRGGDEEERDDSVGRGGGGAEAVHAEGLVRLEDDEAVGACVADAHGERERVGRPREAHLRGRREREAQELEEVADGLHGAEGHRLAHARLGDVHARDAKARARHRLAVRVARRVHDRLRRARGHQPRRTHAW